MVSSSQEEGKKRRKCGCGGTPSPHLEDFPQNSGCPSRTFPTSRFSLFSLQFRLFPHPFLFTFQAAAVMIAPPSALSHLSHLDIPRTPSPGTRARLCRRLSLASVSSRRSADFSFLRTASTAHGTIKNGDQGYATPKYAGKGKHQQAVLEVSRVDSFVSRPLRTLVFSTRRDPALVAHTTGS